MSLKQLPSGLKLAFCPGKGAEDNSCPPANKGTAVLDAPQQGSSAPTFNDVVEARVWLKENARIKMAQTPVDDDTRLVIAQHFANEISHMRERFHLVDEACKTGSQIYLQPYTKGTRTGHLGMYEPAQSDIFIFSGDEFCSTTMEDPPLRLGGQNVGAQPVEWTGNIEDLPENQQVFALELELMGQDLSAVEWNQVDIQSTIRHEYGHSIWFKYLDSKDRGEFNEIWMKEMGDYSRAEGGGAWKLARKISDYATTSAVEGFAECFNAFTHPQYNGELPEVFHEFMTRIMSPKALPKGLKLAFCPGKGAEDNSCPPANKGEGKSEEPKGEPRKLSPVSQELKKELELRIGDTKENIKDLKELLSREPTNNHAKQRVAEFENRLKSFETSLAKLTGPEPKPLDEVWKETKPEVEKAVERLKKEGFPAGVGVSASSGNQVHDYSELEWNDLDEDVKMSVYEKYEEDNISDAVDAQWESLESDMESDIEDEQDKAEYTAEILQLYADDLGIDPTSVSAGHTAYMEGDIEPTYIVYADGTSGKEAEERWKNETQAKWTELYLEQYESDKKEKLEELKEDDDWKQKAYEYASESVSENFNQLDNDELLDLVDDSDKDAALQEKFPDDYNNESDEDENQYTGAVGFPDDGEWSCIDDSEGDYKATQRAVRAIQTEQTAQLLMAKGLVSSKEEAYQEAARLGHKVWGEWKGASQRDYSKMVQLACSDEFGALGKVEYEIDRQKVIEAGGGDDEFEKVKAHLRATWEASQYALEQQGKDTIDVWRAVYPPKDDVDNTTRIKYTQGGGFNDTGDARTKLPDLALTMNGAQSTSGESKTPNSWGGIGSTEGKERVVLRINADRTAALSVPAFGQNIHEEQEVVLLGRHWKTWDAWLNRAPSFPIGGDEANNWKVMQEQQQQQLAS